MTWVHIADVERKARTEYRCDLCGQRIRRRAKHIVRTGFDDGPVTMRMHAVCEAATRDWDLMDWETCDRPSVEFFQYLKGGA